MFTRVAEGCRAVLAEETEHLALEEGAKGDPQQHYDTFSIGSGVR